MFIVSHIKSTNDKRFKSYNIKILNKGKHKYKVHTMILLFQIELRVLSYFSLDQSMTILALWPTPLSLVIFLSSSMSSSNYNFLYE